jgi:hypothetical protein
MAPKLNGATTDFGRIRSEKRYTHLNLAAMTTFIGSKASFIPEQGWSAFGHQSTPQIYYAFALEISDFDQALEDRINGN